MAMRRPRCAGQANDQFPRFFYAVTCGFVLSVLFGERKILEKHGVMATLMNISLLSDIIKYASGSLVVGCLITVLGVFLLFFLIRGFYPKSTFAPLSILTGVVLAILLAIEMVPMCGAISLKWMIDDYEHHIDSFVSEYAKNTAMPISKQESIRLFEMASNEFPLVNQLIEYAYVEGGNAANVASDIASAVDDELNKFVWYAIGWSFLYIIIAAFIVIKTLHSYKEVKYKRNGSGHSGVRTHSRMSGRHTPSKF